MSKSTLRKRIALTATTALFAGMLSVVAAPSASAAVGDTNLFFVSGVAQSGLYVATQNSTTGAGIVDSATAVASTGTSARSLGLLSKDASTGTAQTATVLTGGKLSLYVETATNTSFTTSGGTFSGATMGGNPSVTSYSNDVKTVFLTYGAATTAAAVLYNAPATAGTYTVSMYKATATAQNTATVGVGGTLSGQITVTVVATSAGGSYSAAYSACNTRSASEGHGVATGVDTTSAITNGQTAYIAFDLDDGYDAALESGAVIVSSTGGALVSLASNGSTAAAGTTTTVVSSRIPSDQVVQVTQGTANAPQTSTITISFNGTTVCTKTITHRGEIAKLTVGSVGTQDLGSGAGSATWIADGTNRAGIFTVTAADSAGNTVVPAVAGFAAVAATLTTTVQAITISSANVATSISSTTAAWNYSVGNFTCGAIAGESKVKIQYTNPSTGTTVTSAEFTARCADDPYTYTASFDKASYVQGENATLTVQFLDSKGNKANNVGAPGSLTFSTPMLTAVSATDSATNLASKSDGTRQYTFAVGTASGATTGAYTSIIDFPSLTNVAAVKATPSYKISTGTDDVAFSEVLKSVVALIASINKQIQALQKLILQRKR